MLDLLNIHCSFILEQLSLNLETPNPSLRRASGGLRGGRRPRQEQEGQAPPFLRSVFWVLGFRGSGFRVFWFRGGLGV